MKIIRLNTWESNSSSCHTISIIRTPLEDRYPAVSVSLNERFGWSGPLVATVEERLAYILIYARDWCGYGSSFDGNPFYEKINEVYKKYTGYDLRIIHETEGYIDHQSVEDKDLHHYFEDDDLLAQFIFGETTIEIDNDNH